MLELQVEDWKLEAQAVVQLQLCRKKCDKSVSLSVFIYKNVTSSYIKVSLDHMKFRAPDSLHITVMLLGGSTTLHAECSRSVQKQASCGSSYTLRTMRMTSSKCVLQQRHLLGYESEP